MHMRETTCCASFLVIVPSGSTTSPQLAIHVSHHVRARRANRRRDRSFVDLGEDLRVLEEVVLLNLGVSGGRVV